MGKIDNIELRKQKNAPFCKAFDYIAELKEVSDKVLAELIGSKGPYISMYRAMRSLASPTSLALMM